MDIRSKKAKKKKIINILILFLIFFIVIMVIDHAVQVNIIKNYLLLRFNYDYKQYELYEESFYERYEFFDDTLKERELANKNNEINRQLILTLKQSSVLKEYKIKRIDNINEKPAYIVDVSFIISEEENNTFYNGEFSLEIILNKCFIFQYKIFEINTIPIEHNTNH